MARPTRDRRRGRIASCLLMSVVLLATAGCNRDDGGQTSDAAPSTQDAYRMAAAANDPIINTDSDFVALGPLTQRPYRCANAATCQPTEQTVERDVTAKGVTKAQIATFYIEKLAASGWRVEAAYCDAAKNEFAVVASKRTNTVKTYPGRFELLAKDTVKLRITMPAFGTESTFVLAPDPSNYPAGACPDKITTAVDAARKAAEKITATTLKNDGTGVPGTVAAP